MGAGQSTRKEPGYGHIYLLTTIDEETQYVHIQLHVHDYNSQVKMHEFIRKKEETEYVFSNEYMSSNVTVI
jgi:hypothetical protein